MSFGSWLKKKAREMREEREFKKGVEAEARSLEKEVYRQHYRIGRLKQAEIRGQQRAKPKPSFMVTLGKNLMESDFNLFGEPTKKRTRHKKKR
jgi:hypothetical protein